MSAKKSLIVLLGRAISPTPKPVSTRASPSLVSMSKQQVVERTGGRSGRMLAQLRRWIRMGVPRAVWRDRCA
jgi:hypothetical protein